MTTERTQLEKTVVPSAIVALFVRVPLPGQVKTRLAKALGDVFAYELYLAMVTDMLANIKGAGFPLYLFHDGNDECELPMEWVASAGSVIAQQGGTIGERMDAAFAHCFAAGIDQVYLLGSDIPGLDATVILSAAAALTSHDVAIAPAIDGGYCLIAFKRDSYQPDLLAKIPWSTDQVLRTTLARSDELGLAVALLTTLQDIDTIDDLKAYCREQSASALQTNAFLSRNGCDENHGLNSA